MYIQRLFKPVTDTGEPLNLGHVLDALLPEELVACGKNFQSISEGRFVVTPKRQVMLTMAARYCDNFKQKTEKQRKIKTKCFRVHCFYESFLHAWPLLGFSWGWGVVG